ncbi:primosomal protein DnaI [Jeotgalibaca sp. MA1X17-3]|uniref:primosomal protein DnaI n=1 Tax=Jeotgalibaca sp. MA1X17-3 TaxID=2908211 RepID=UPI001F467059|nr:primosomal protein DnaI [Jeotgalibaca sp. MA1X17-3]UJF15174.1 primosomal protein DnaI [Jeotgalibaca sp. MA1X17-3]
MDHVGKGFRKYMSDPKISKQYQEMIESVHADPAIQAFFDEHQELLSQEMISNSYSKLYEFLNEKNKLEQGKIGQNPGYEPHLALNAGYIDVVYRPTAETIKKEKERELRGRIQSINVPKDVRSATMDKFLKTSDRMEVLDFAFDFIESYADQPHAHHRGMYLYGPFGVGKTYLLGAIAYELSLRGHLTTLMHYPTFTQEMKASIADNSVSGKLDVIKKAEVLMLDDIGADINSTWVRDEVLGVILQYRMQEELPTFFSSNLNFKELEEHFRVGNRGEDEPIKAKRLMERVLYLSKQVKMTGKNRRLQE